MKRVSVCMIVRDEEAMLPGCLASVRELAHEIIVIDTGSTDRTVDIAKRARARVEEITWTHDFAAARNASLNLARGDWVLVLDADERLAPGGARAIRRAIAHAEFDCGMLPMHEATRPDAPLDKVVRGSARLGEPNHLPRLLRNTSDLRFEGIIHESILGWLRARGMRVGFVDAPLVHLGASREIREARGKAARNVALLERARDAKPDDPTPLGYLAHEHLEAGKLDEAREAVTRGWELAEKAPRGSLVSVLRLATARARLFLEASDAHGVIDTVDRAVAMEGAHPDLDFFRGSAHEIEGLASRSAEARTKHLELALEAYGAALAARDRRFAQAFVIGATTWASSTRRGAVLLALGRVKDARAAFADAIAAKPDHREAAIGLSECRLEEGEHEAVLAGIEPLLDDRPDGWLIGAAALEALGLLDDFRVFLARARERAVKGYLSPHRRERHATLHGALAAYLGAPMAVPGPAGAVFALLAREPLPHPEGAPYALDRARIDVITGNLLAAGRIELVTALLEPRAEQVIPGLHDAVAAAAAKRGLTIADDGEPVFAFLGALGSAELEILRGLTAAHPDLCVVDAEGARDLDEMLSGGADGVNSAKGAAVRAWLAARAPGKKRVIFATSSALVHLDRAAVLVPGARFVMLARDVRALVARPSADVLGEPGDAAARAARWAELVRTIRASGAAVPGRYLELRYEDLLADPPAAARKLLAFLGERDEPRVLRHLVDAYPGRPDRWKRELAAEARHRVEAVAGEALATLGYEVAT